MGALFEQLKTWARILRRDVVALWFAARDPRTPRLARLIAAALAAYALSPIDLIPDFIPVLGYLDELVLLPLGIAAVIRLIPPGLMAEFRGRATADLQRPTSRIAAATVVLIWLTCGVLLSVWAVRRFG
jgi:uncharacterized membrane protein YkvA (DUF1232 family)